MKSIYFPPSAYCLLPTAYCIRGEFELAGLLARTAVYDKMSPPTEKKSGVRCGMCAKIQGDNGQNHSGTSLSISRAAFPLIPCRVSCAYDSFKRLAVWLRTVCVGRR